MKFRATVVVAFFLSGCSSNEQRNREAMMDDIERQIELPAGARHLENYARAYRESAPNRVSAIYFTPLKPDPDFCRGARSGGADNAGQIALSCPPPDGMNQGERRWFPGKQALPDVLDGGCNYIDVEFNVGSRRIISAECHGLA